MKCSRLTCASVRGRAANGPLGRRSHLAGLGAGLLLRVLWGELVSSLAAVEGGDPSPLSYQEAPPAATIQIRAELHVALPLDDDAVMPTSRTCRLSCWLAGFG